jgi:hypothetical protein
LRLLERETRDASDRLLLPITQLRAPASRGFLSRREVALARSRGGGVSRCHHRFGGSFASAPGDSPSIAPAKDRASDAPVASPCTKRWRFRTHRFARGRRDRLRRVFVKRARLHDPKRLPSAGDSVSRSTARDVLPPSTRYGPRLSPVSWLRHHDPVLDARSRVAAFGVSNLAVRRPRLSDDARPPFTRARVFVRKVPGSSFSGSGHRLPISATHSNDARARHTGIRSSPAPLPLSERRATSLIVLATEASRNDRVPDRSERATAHCREGFPSSALRLAWGPPRAYELRGDGSGHPE